MASKMIGLIIIASLIHHISAEPFSKTSTDSLTVLHEPQPVMLDERHLRPPENQQQQDAANGWQDSVPGLPGRDYPNLTSIPRTSFSCAGKTPGGYYADVETRCQVFHVCNTQGDKSSFLCPSGSIFNQRHFVCDWWYDFECEQAPELYSLNKGLNDDTESTSSSSERPLIDEETIQDSPPLQYNSLGGSGGDLSLASSGYANNIRDEANSIYEDYTSRKISDVSATTTSSTPISPPTSPSSIFSGSTTSSHRKESTYDRAEVGRLNGFTEQSPKYQARNYQDNRQTLTYRRRPSQGPDNVPRGFSKNRAEEQLNWSDQGPGLLINNGLSEEFERNQNNPLPRENNNYVDRNNYNSEASNNVSSNYNNVNINNNRNQNQYQNLKNPLPQENNNYVNSNNNYNKNFNSNHQINNNANSNYQTISNINSNHQSSNTFNNYQSNNDFKTDHQTNNNAYSNNIINKNFYNQNNINSNDQQNTNNNDINYENYHQKSETIDSVPAKNFDFPENHYEHNLETPTEDPRFVFSSPSEDDVDRERQREVDSVDLKKQRPSPRNYNDYPTPSFIIREEGTAIWRDDLSTSSSDSNSPPYPPERTYQSSERLSLSKPEEVTTPIVEKKRPQFLGRRPHGGLPGGPGNGLPGANKVVIASDDITGKPGEDVSLNKVSTSRNENTGVTSGWNDREGYNSASRAYEARGDNGKGDNANGQYWNNGQWNDGQY